MEHRYWPPSSGSYAPMTYIRGIPVDVTVLLIVTHVLTMLVTTFLLAFNHKEFLANWIFFSPQALAQGKIWTAATYAFANDIVSRNIWFAVEMVIFFFCGREVERFIGRNNFIWYYAMLVLIAPTLLAPVAWATGSSLIWWGSWSVHLAMLIGFITIYPEVQFFLGLRAKWVALIYLSVITLMEVARGQWFSLGQVWITVGTAWLYLKYNGVGGGLMVFDTWQSWREERTTRKIDARREQKLKEAEEKSTSVDEVLEKISRQGMGSLSEDERLLLEEASRELSNRDGRSD